MITLSDVRRKKNHTVRQIILLHHVGVTACSLFTQHHLVVTIEMYFTTFLQMTGFNTSQASKGFIQTRKGIAARTHVFLFILTWLVWWSGSPKTKLKKKPIKHSSSAAERWCKVNFCRNASQCQAAAVKQLIGPSGETKLIWKGDDTPTQLH